METLAIGDITAGTIGASDEVDELCFDATNGSIIDLAIAGNPRDGGFRPVASIFAPSGALVDRFHADSGNRRISIRETGQFRLHVNDDALNATGNYTIGMEGIRPASPSPVPVLKGGIVGGTIATPLEKDQLTFTGSRGDQIALLVSSTDTSGGFRAAVELISPSGNRVDFFYDSSGIRKHRLSESGTFLIQISDDHMSHTGEYSLAWEGLVPYSPNPTSVASGGITFGSIDTPLEQDQFTFAGRAGDIVDLAMTSTAMDPSFNARVEIISPTGSLVDSFEAASGNRRHKLSETGSYILHVHDINYARRGTYTIGFEGISPISPGPTILKSRRTATGTIEHPLQKDQYVFNGTANQIVTMVLTSVSGEHSFAPRAEVLDSAGNRLDYFTTSSGERRLTLRHTGTYTIQVFDENLSRRGAYGLLSDFGDAAVVWHNTVTPTDVNGDTKISPIDAIFVINELTTRQVSDRTTGRLGTSELLSAYLDVNNDGVVSPIDAIRVINAFDGVTPQQAASSSAVKMSAISALAKQPDRHSMTMAGLSRDRIGLRDLVFARSIARRESLN